MADDQVEVTVTVKIPQGLVLDMQKAALQASIEGGVRAQEGLMQAWTGIWLQASEQAQGSFLNMMGFGTKQRALPPAKK